MDVRVLARSPDELDVTQSRPVGPILGVLDRHILESEAEDHLELHVVVPDQKLMELVDAIEFVLDVQGLALGRHRQPHVVGDVRVLIGGVQAGTIDRPLRAGQAL